MFWGKILRHLCGAHSRLLPERHNSQLGKLARIMKYCGKKFILLLLSMHILYFAKVNF